MAGIAAPATLAASSQSAQTCVTGPYIAFFGASSAEFDSYAAQAIGDALLAYRNCGGTDIHIGGNSDTAESEDYALRRAQAVQSYLIAQGIPNAKIRSWTFGSRRLRVETYANVSEIQNRRVEIFFGSTSPWE
jgi:outer membrane protein OmpA-like peptidoglycan-associated protein